MRHPAPGKSGWRTTSRAGEYSDLYRRFCPIVFQHTRRYKFSMWVIIGLVIVFGSIVGGYLMEKGNLMVLVQPAELVIIGGAALGTIFIANPLPTVMRMFKGMIGALAGSRYDKKFYLETLAMLGDIFQTARKQGMAKLEGDIEDPKASVLFGKYPKFQKDHLALD